MAKLALSMETSLGVSKIQVAENNFQPDITFKLDAENDAMQNVFQLQNNQPDSPEFPVEASALQLYNNHNNDSGLIKWAPWNPEISFLSNSWNLISSAHSSLKTRFDGYKNEVSRLLESPSLIFNDNDNKSARQKNTLRNSRSIFTGIQRTAMVGKAKQKGKRIDSRVVSWVRES
ncbi:hypothetical protein HK096_010125, partial [Nowakowskiella sp. JEL0078]